MRAKLVFCVVVIVVGIASIAMAQTGFEWVPLGGKDLLVEWLGESATSEQLADVLQAERTQEQWAAIIRDQDVLFSENEIQTLASYLAINAPVHESQVPATVQGVASLGRDGREIFLQNCMLCHTIAQPAITDRSVAGWKTHLGRGEHQAIRLSEQEKETFVHYLAQNMPVPEEEIPQELLVPIPGY